MNFWKLAAVSAVFALYGCNDSSSGSETLCDKCGLSNDASTSFFEDFETMDTSFDAVTGICGKALSVAPGSGKFDLKDTLNGSISAGTIEFWFRPGADFYETSRMLLGSDEARLLFVYDSQDSVLYFLKNHTNLPINISAAVVFDTSWNHIAGEWGHGKMSLWLNGALVADTVFADSDYSSYQPASTITSVLKIGEKSSCCMEAIGVHSELYSSGDYDQVRVSNIMRY